NDLSNPVDNPIDFLTLYSSFLMLYPLTQASPYVGSMRVEMVFRKVVFPAPLGPSKTNISPF
ncbi:MAG: hypothetical protein PWQ66_662, partial [Petrotoga sp.]|nr:hypothetical protein [Petrotoga sp.]